MTCRSLRPVCCLCMEALGMTVVPLRPLAGSPRDQVRAWAVVILRRRLLRLGCYVCPGGIRSEQSLHIHPIGTTERETSRAQKNPRTVEQLEGGSVCRSRNTSRCALRNAQFQIPSRDTG
eukprot:scaffold21_cov368-Prasinococcus_capsulatus_cf.AAC.19